MQEDKTFSAFYFELSVIVNSYLNLREVIPESNIVRKILRSLSERSRPNVIAIKKSKEVDSIRVNELIGSLQTYEMTLLDSQKHEHNDYLAFVIFVDYVHKFEIECEFTDEQNDQFLENIVVEYQCLIEKFMKVNDIFIHRNLRLI